MPFILIVTDEPIDDPVKLCAAVETAMSWFHPVDDGWIAHLDVKPNDHDSRDPRAQNRERQRRYRDRKRVTRNADSVTDVTPEISENGGVTGRVTQKTPFSVVTTDGRNAQPLRETALRVTRNAVTQEPDWTADTEPFTDHDRARGKRGAAGARAVAEDSVAPLDRPIVLDNK